MQTTKPFRRLCSVQRLPWIGEPHTLNGLRVVDEVTTSWVQETPRILTVKGRHDRSSHERAGRRRDRQASGASSSRRRCGRDTPYVPSCLPPRAKRPRAARFLQASRTPLAQSHDVLPPLPHDGIVRVGGLTHEEVQARRLAWIYTGRDRLTPPDPK
jgi:hypothetical protein